MSAAAQAGRVAFLPEVWLVPATLADLECPHGELGGCEQCELDEQQPAVDGAGELEQVPA